MWRDEIQKNENEKRNYVIHMFAFGRTQMWAIKEDIQYDFMAIHSLSVRLRQDPNDISIVISRRLPESNCGKQERGEGDGREKQWAIDYGTETHNIVIVVKVWLSFIFAARNARWALSLSPALIK